MTNLDKDFDSTEAVTTQNEGQVPAPLTGGTPTSVAPANAEPRPKQRRGFAAMDRRLVSEIASKGGRAAHAAGTAHEFSAEEARNAGRKGGLAPHAQRRRTSTTEAKGA